MAVCNHGCFVVKIIFTELDEKTFMLVFVESALMDAFKLAVADATHQGRHWLLPLKVFLSLFVSISPVSSLHRWDVSVRMSSLSAHHDLV